MIKQSRCKVTTFWKSEDIWSTIKDENWQNYSLKIIKLFIILNHLYTLVIITMWQNMLDLNSNSVCKIPRWRPVIIEFKWMKLNSRSKCRCINRVKLDSIWYLRCYRWSHKMPLSVSEFAKSQSVEINAIT